MDFNDKNVKIGILLVILLFISLIGNIFFINKINNFKEDKKEVIYDNIVAVKEEVEEEKEEAQVIREFVVDIKGQVKKPGIYKLKEGSRIQDVIKKAGGLKSSANTKNINLSKKISDEMVIYIYSSSELKKINSTVETCKVGSEIISSCEGSGVIEVGDSSNDNVISGKVSINTGSVEELMTLDGIGESKAKSIIAYREKNGLFTSLEQIMNVSGIGEAAYSKIKDNITL